MNRRQFLQTMIPISLLGSSFGLRELSKISKDMPTTDMFPMLFLGHGSPMNAIEDNQFVQWFKKVAEKLPIPNAILCISAHWQTKGTKVTAMPQPKTIHDFGGFPQALYDVQYPAPGSPELAQLTQEIVTSQHIELDHTWGLDHGAWSVIKHIYPQANIPVVQLSLDYYMSPQQHFELAQELSVLRTKGILIIGSGNIVHNLRMVAWDKMNVYNYAYDWALEASNFFKDKIIQRDFQPLLNYRSQGTSVNLAIPTPEHFLPLIYTLGLTHDKESLDLFNDEYVAGSLTMTSLQFGL